MTPLQREVFEAIDQRMTLWSRAAAEDLAGRAGGVEWGDATQAACQLRQALGTQLPPGVVRDVVYELFANLMHDVFVTLDGGSHEFRTLLVDGDTGSEIGIANNEEFMAFVIAKRRGLRA